MMGVPVFLAHPGAFDDGGDLRHADPGDDARGADRAGAHSHLDGVGSGIDEAAGALGGADIAGNDLQIRESPA